MPNNEKYTIFKGKLFHTTKKGSILQWFRKHSAMVGGVGIVFCGGLENRQKMGRYVNISGSYLQPLENHIGEHFARVCVVAIQPPPFAQMPVVDNRCNVC